MRVTFWGTRGSIAKPGPTTVRYGGNTSCVEVRADDGTLVVLDCGTGAHGLGQALVAPGGRVRGHLLIGHTHWDHIQGFPFFAPLFVPGNEWDVYAPRGLLRQLRETLVDQMQYAFFPVPLDALPATIRYHDLLEGTFEADGIRVSTRYLNHPALTLGYRLEADGAALVYATDHEPHDRASATPTHVCAGHFAHREDRRHADFLRGAGMIIHDTQYTAAEYPARVGWGHSTVEYVVDMAVSAGVREVALFHHDPMRSDAAVDQLVEAARERAAGAVTVFGAAEGDTVRVSAAAPDPASNPADSAEFLQPRGQAVLVAAPDPALAEAVRAEGFTPLPPGANVLAAAIDPTVALVLLDRALLDNAPAIRASSSVPIVVVSSAFDADDELATDWLVRPFSLPYARTRLRAWLLRTRARWTAAPLPPNEPERLAAVRRFDALGASSLTRVLRVAERLFDVPFISVSLVDAERQRMYKPDATIEPLDRDVSLCAHVVCGDAPLVVVDAATDDRYGDNPVFADQRYRSYAGTPLKDTTGHTVGTLCMLDHRPRHFGADDLRLLADLADLAGAEMERSRR